MNYIKFIISVIVTICIFGCDRQDYVTWKCQPSLSSEKSFSMITLGAKLSIASDSYLYCVSLGPYSYFDMNCPASTNQSNIAFEQKSGILIIKQKKYQCSAL
jgi:hypothetical protein